MIRLGVNIDHVATVRQARLGKEPAVVDAAIVAQHAGADSITVHLREDRRHIQDADVEHLKSILQIPLNLEMAVDSDVLTVAQRVQPAHACLVPERREELTTEGGLLISEDNKALRQCIDCLRNQGTRVSLFIEPDPETVRLAKKLGADAVELHTGSWAHAWGTAAEAAQTSRLEAAANAAAEVGIELHAGHGITFRNVSSICHLSLLREFNIGHSIISQAIFTGLDRAIRDMRQAIDRAGY